MYDSFCKIIAELSIFHFLRGKVHINFLKFPGDKINGIEMYREQTDHQTYFYIDKLIRMTIIYMN